MHFVRLSFIAAIDYKIIFTMKISRVKVICMHIDNTHAHGPWCNIHVLELKLWMANDVEVAR